MYEICSKLTISKFRQGYSFTFMFLQINSYIVCLIWPTLFFFNTSITEHMVFENVSYYWALHKKYFFSIKDFFSKCHQIRCFIFTEKILNGKLHFLCSGLLQTLARFMIILVAVISELQILLLNSVEFWTLVLYTTRSYWQYMGSIIICCNPN